MADPLSNLGNIILDTGREYAQRQQRLQDVASARDYDTQVRDQQQGFQMAMQDRAVQNDIKLQLIHEGLLAPGDINEPAKIAAAFEEARARGLDKLYNELLTTPDETGKPLLTRADLRDPGKIEAAKQRLAEVKSRLNKFQLDQPGLAQQALGRLDGEAAQITNRLAQLEQKLSDPQPQPDLREATMQAVRNLQALKKNPNYMPSQAEIQGELQNVLPQLQQRLDMRWLQDKQDAQVQYQTLHARLQDVRAQSRQLQQEFRVAPPTPTASAPTSQATPESPRTHGAASPEQIAAAIQAVMRSGGAAAQGPATDSTPFPQTFNDPVIQQANAAATKTKQTQVQAQLNSLLQDIQNTDQNIRKAQAPEFPGFYPNPSSSFGDSELGFLPQSTQDSLRAPAAPDLNARADTLVALHNRRKALQTEYDKLRQQLLGPSAPMTPPSTTTSSFAQPNTLRGPTQFIPDNLQQPAY